MQNGDVTESHSIICSTISSLYGIIRRNVWRICGSIMDGRITDADAVLLARCVNFAITVSSFRSICRSIYSM